MYRVYNIVLLHERLRRQYLNAMEEYLVIKYISVYNFFYMG